MPTKIAMSVAMFDYLKGAMGWAGALLTPMLLTWRHVWVESFRDDHTLFSPPSLAVEGFDPEEIGIEVVLVS